MAKDERENLLLDDNAEIDFSPLWADQEQSDLMKYIPAVIQIIILIVVLIKVWH